MTCFQERNTSTWNLRLTVRFYMTISGFMWLHKVLYGSIQGFIVDKLLLNISVFDIYDMLQDVTVNCKIIKLCTNEPQIQEISNYSYPLLCVSFLFLFPKKYLQYWNLNHSVAQGYVKTGLYLIMFMLYVIYPLYEVYCCSYSQ